MDDLISRQAAIEALTEYGHGRAVYIGVDTAVGCIDQLPPAQLSTNLAEVGTDCISRQAAIEALKNRQDDGKGDISRFYNTIIQHDIEAIEQLPSAQPEIIRCKDCKHWKDSDGVFRRGIGAESRCPLNLHQVYEGTFFCGLGERREVTT